MCLERRAPGRLHAQLRIQALAGQALEREGRGAGKREGSAASGLSSRFLEAGLPSVMFLPEVREFKDTRPNFLALVAVVVS